MRSLLKWTWRIAAFILTTRCLGLHPWPTVSAQEFSTRCDFEKSHSSCEGWQWSRHFRVGGGPRNSAAADDDKAQQEDPSLSVPPHGWPDYEGNYDGHFLFYEGTKVTKKDFPTLSSPRLNSDSDGCELQYLLYQKNTQGASVQYYIEYKYYHQKNESALVLSTFRSEDVQEGWSVRRHKIGSKTYPFEVILQIQQVEGENADETTVEGLTVAVDNVEVRNCSRNDIMLERCDYVCQPNPTEPNVTHCIENSRFCDLTTDCPLADDERRNCDKVPEFARCDFENNQTKICGNWSNDSAEESGYWVRSQRKSKERTGPQGDHTFGNESGHYMFLKFTTKNMGHQVKMVSPVIQPPFYYHRSPNSPFRDSCTIRFYYFFTRGNKNADLKVSAVEQTVHSGRVVTLATVTQSQEDEWQRKVIIVPHGIRHPYKLAFVGERKYSSGGYPAIDDFTMSPECFGINVPDSAPRNDPSEPPSWVGFNTCGSIGSKGPSMNLCLARHYNGPEMPAPVNVTLGGIQVFKVQKSGLYTIFAKGAAGGQGLKNDQGRGRGDYVRAAFFLEQDEEIYVIVGQKGSGADTHMNDDSFMVNVRNTWNPLKKGSVIKRSITDLKNDLRRIKTQKAEAGGGGGGGATFVFKVTGDSENQEIVLLLAAAGGGGLSTEEANHTLYVNPDGMGLNFSVTAEPGLSEKDEAGGGGAFGDFVHVYSATGRSVTLAENSGVGGEPCKKDKVYGGAGGFGGGGGGCEGGGGGGGYRGGNGGSGSTDNGRGGYSYISSVAMEQLVEKGVNEDDGSVVLAMAMPGAHCNCAQWCVYLTIETKTRKCACSKEYALNPDGKSCSFKPGIRDPRTLSLQHMIVIVLCILVSIAVILFFFCLAFNHFRKTQAAGRVPSQEGLSNAEVQLSRLRAQAAGAGGGMVTEYNPNYEFGGSTCTLQDLKEIPRENLTLVKALGQGAFGEVYQGYLANVPGETSELTVAVKTLPEAASAQAEQDFFTEAMIMNKFNHPNIVRFIGVCFEKLPRFIVLELLPGGDLKSFLRAFRPKPSTSPMLTMADLLRLASDVAKGCQYLEENHFIHRDIAARNCLLTTKSSSGVVKIADFGMARDIYRADYYRKGGKAMLPVKWMPPEAFMDGVFTSKTDIWSFGVLLWEVMSLGYMPYPGRGNQEVMQLVTSGRRLEAPRGCPGPVYHLMTQCWHPVPEERPTFGTILERLGYCSQDPDVISTPLPVFDRPPSMEKDATIMRPSSDSAETCLQSPGSEDYLIPMPSSNYSLGTVMSDLQSGSTSVDSMDRLLGGPSSAVGGRSLGAVNRNDVGENVAAPELPPRAPNIVFSPSEACAGNVLKSPDGTWETSFSTPNNEGPSTRPDGYIKIPAEDGATMLTNIGPNTKTSSTLSLDALPAAPPAPTEKAANLLESEYDEGASAPLLVSLDENPNSAVFNGACGNAVGSLQTLDATSLNQNLQTTPHRLSYANVDVNSAKSTAILDTTELPFPINEQSNVVNC